MARILVAEDDKRQAELIRSYLERDGHHVLAVHDGRSALEEARRLAPDLIVLDLMMPGMHGLDVCRVLRYEHIDVPIVMVTARSSEEDVLLGLDLGADDYLTKPYRLRELVARVRVVLRRRGPGAAPVEGDVVSVGRLAIDLGRVEVRVDGERADLTPKEFAVLRALLAADGRALTRRQLLDVAFGFDHYALERTVDMHVMHLRRKLEPDPAEPEHLLTVKGVGYRLVTPAEHAAAGSSRGG